MFIGSSIIYDYDRTCTKVEHNLTGKRNILGHKDSILWVEHSYLI